MKTLINFLLILISSAVLSEEIKNDDFTEDWRNKATVCHVHKVKLTPIKVSIFWGTPSDEYRDDPRMERNHKYPYSKVQRVFGGCCIVEKPVKYALIHHCSECTKQANQWIIDNVKTPKHKRPLAPKFDKSHNRLLRKLQKINTPPHPSANTL